MQDLFNRSAFLRGKLKLSVYVSVRVWVGREGVVLRGIARFVSLCVSVSVPVPVLACTYVCFE